MARFGGWYYFSKVKREGEEADLLFGDNHSKRQKVHRILAFLLLTGFPLYFQTLIVFPSINLVDSTLPRFYGFFHIVMIVLMLLHMAALFLIARMAWKLKHAISE